MRAGSLEDLGARGFACPPHFWGLGLGYQPKSKVSGSSPKKMKCIVSFPSLCGFLWALVVQKQLCSIVQWVTFPFYGCWFCWIARRLHGANSFHPQLPSDFLTRLTVSSTGLCKVSSSFRRYVYTSPFLRGLLPSSHSLHLLVPDFWLSCFGWVGVPSSKAGCAIFPTLANFGGCVGGLVDGTDGTEVGRIVFLRRHERIISPVRMNTSGGYVERIFCACFEC